MGPRARSRREWRSSKQKERGGKTHYGEATGRYHLGDRESPFYACPLALMRSYKARFKASALNMTTSSNAFQTCLIYRWPGSYSFTALAPGQITFCGLSLRRRRKEAFAREHDAAILRCLAALIANNDAQPLGTSQAGRAHLPLSWGGMGLRSAERVRYAAYWGSWADSLTVLQERLPGLTEQMLHSVLAVQAAGHATRVQEARVAADVLRQAGSEPPA